MSKTNPNYGYEFSVDDNGSPVHSLSKERETWKQVSVGSRIAVYWKDDDQYYNATVVMQYGSTSTFHLLYDDSAKEKLDLSKEEIMLISSDNEEEEESVPRHHNTPSPSFQSMPKKNFDSDDEAGESSDENESVSNMQNRRKKLQQLTIKEVAALAARLNPKDIVCGRGLSNVSTKRYGYLEFRRLIDDKYKEYDQKPQNERRAVCEYVIKSMIQKGIRFVQWATDEQTFEPLSYNKAVSKVMQTFRDVRSNKISLRNDSSDDEFRDEAAQKVVDGMGPNDIACGRGHSRSSNQRHGYYIFRNLIDTMINEYDNAGRSSDDGGSVFSTKRGVCEKVFKILTEQEIRFVQYDEKDDKWERLCDEKAIGKIMQTFRDKRGKKVRTIGNANRFMKEPIRHTLLLNRKPPPKRKRGGAKNRKKKRVKVDPSFIVDTSKQYSATPVQQDHEEESEEDVEEVEAEYTVELKKRAKEASIKDVAEKCKDGEFGNLERKDDSVCHVCHKRVHETYRFGCKVNAHTYCAMHCRVSSKTCIIPIWVQHK